MEKQINNKLVIVILVVLIFAAIFIKSIPEYQKKLGSSDINIDYEKENKLVGLKYNYLTEIIIVINDNKISNILFLNDYAYVLYNKNIEGKSLPDGIEKINDILENENILNDKRNKIEITKYNDATNETNKIKQMLSHNIVDENYMTLSNKIKLLNIKINDNTENLKTLEQYSKEVIRLNKNNISKNNIVS